MNAEKERKKQVGIWLLRNQGIFDCVMGKSPQRKNKHYLAGYESRLDRPF